MSEQVKEAQEASTSELGEAPDDISPRQWLERLRWSRNLSKAAAFLLVISTVAYLFEEWTLVLISIEVFLRDHQVPVLLTFLIGPAVMAVVGLLAALHLAGLVRARVLQACFAAVSGAALLLVICMRVFRGGAAGGGVAFAIGQAGFFLTVMANCYALVVMLAPRKRAAEDSAAVVEHAGSEPESTLPYAQGNGISRPAWGFLPLAALYSLGHCLSETQWLWPPSADPEFALEVIQTAGWVLIAALLVVIRHDVRRVVCVEKTAIATCFGSAGVVLVIMYRNVHAVDGSMDLISWSMLRWLGGPVLRFLTALWTARTLAWAAAITSDASLVSVGAPRTPGPNA